MHAPGLQWRGATSAPFPGYLLIGRGEDFATTLTSSSGDIIDQYVETLCDGSDEKYLYKGQCRPMGHFNAGTPQRRAGQVPDHRARAGRRLRDGQRASAWRSRPSARATARTSSTSSSSAGSRPAQVDSPKSFFKAAAQTPQTFNSFYIDHKHVAEYTSGRLPIRPKSVDPGLPTLGTGQYEWTGLPVRRRSIPGHRSARRDDRQLEQRFRPRVRRRGRQLGPQRLGRSASTCWTATSAAEKKNGKWTLAARRRGDERRRDPGRARDRHGAAAARCSRARTAPSPHGRADARAAGRTGARTAAAGWTATSTARSTTRARRSWTRPGPDRRRVHEAGARPAARRAQLALLAPRSAARWPVFDGWYQYFERDIRGLLGMPVESPFQNSYCGGGNLGLPAGDLGGAPAPPARS